MIPGHDLQAVILCGGMGTRLGALTAETPKPLLPVGGRPFLEWLLQEVARHGYRRIMLLAGFGAAEIGRFARECPLVERFGLQVEVSIEPEPLGTGGALRHARHLLDPHFLLLNGDSFFDTDLLALRPADCPAGGATLAVRHIDDSSRYGGLRIEDGRITAFAEKRAEAGPGWINAGIYMCDRAMLARLAPKSSLEVDLFPLLAAEGRLCAAECGGFFIDIGLPETYEGAQSLIPEHLTRPAAFLDRDGVINVDHGHVGHAGRLQWVDGAAEAICRLNRAGWLVFVVTNQAGVAKGFYGIDDVERLHGHMAGVLAEQGAHVDDWRYCPWHEEGVVPEYRGASNWRKPEPGMLLDLLSNWQCRLEGSFLIGDKPSDLEAARAAGVPQQWLFEGGRLDSFLAAKLNLQTVAG